MLEALRWEFQRLEGTIGPDEPFHLDLQIFANSAYVVLGLAYVSVGSSMCYKSMVHFQYE